MNKQCIFSITTKWKIYNFCCTYYTCQWTLFLNIFYNTYKWKHQGTLTKTSNATHNFFIYFLSTWPDQVICTILLLILGKCIRISLILIFGFTEAVCSTWMDTRWNLNILLILSRINWPILKLFCQYKTMIMDILNIDWHCPDSTLTHATITSKSAWKSHWYAWWRNVTKTCCSWPSVWCIDYFMPMEKNYCHWKHKWPPICSQITCHHSATGPSYLSSAHAWSLLTSITRCGTDQRSSSEQNQWPDCVKSIVCSRFEKPTLQQDNARSHVARVCKDNLRQHNVQAQVSHTWLRLKLAT